VTLTQSKKNILIKRVRAGRSIKEIAAEFKVTKNSISGHINRLRGLYGDELKCAQQSTYARAPKVTEDKSPKDIATGVTFPHAVHFNDLKRGQCSYPIWACATDTPHDKHMYCGSPVAAGKSYCAACHARCWTVAPRLNVSKSICSRGYARQGGETDCATLAPQASELL